MTLAMHKDVSRRWLRWLTRCELLLVAFAMALATGCASTNYLTVREKPHNSLAGTLDLFSRGGPRPSPRTEQLLRRYDLIEKQKQISPVVLVNLEQEIAQDPSPEKIYSFAEIAYVDGTRALAASQEDLAMDLFGSAVAHAYLYLFDPRLEPRRNTYDPQFRLACDVYNSSLEAGLRILKKRGKLKPGETQMIRTANDEFSVAVEVHGAWRSEDFERLEFASDFDVEGLTNKYHTYGLGVPLIAVRKSQPQQSAAEKFYPQGLTFPVTAFLRVHRPAHDVAQAGGAKQDMRCTLELHDPLLADQINVCGREVPLETDLSTPLGYFLDSPNFKAGKVATLGLLRPSKAQRLEGIYMVEPYDPRKIPVLMVHGLWSSPTTWMEMFNDLRALPEVRERYQFWFHLYPTGQPFWISAAQLRADLDELKMLLDPRSETPALHRMILVGHSMGGLVSRMQTIDSRDDFWRVISDKDFAELKVDEETRTKLARVLFFRPNPSVQRVITIGTPHQGSKFANDTTQWLGRYLITLPAMMVQTSQRVVRDNPGFFKDTDMLTITTSIDSLAPDCPIFPVLNRAPKAHWVKHHNIVGMQTQQKLLRKIVGTGDGVVGFRSAHLPPEEVESEIVVDADHVNIHRHPRSVLEVRRILLEHMSEMVLR